MIDIINSFKDCKALVIGDSMLDTYLWGNVNRISPEAPVPIVSLNKRENRLGGAANVALNIKSLGAEVALCCVTGNDPEAKLFNDLLQSNKIGTDAVVVDESRITSVKNRIISNNQHLIRIDNESTDDLDESITNQLLDKIENLIQNVDVVVFQDYDKGMISAKLIERTIFWAKKKDIPVVVDPKKNNFHNYKGASLFKPNLRELEEGLKIDVDKTNIDNVKDASDKLMTALEADAVMITLSELGIFVSDGKNHNIIPTEAQKIVDVSGAGDTVISIAALCLATNQDLSSTAKLANLAAGIVIESVGVVPIETNELIKRIEHL
ncbi:MAG: D-glycero-beta-D-manno-heptose-7-phosphate kinase [Bacteroidia bacterium]|nr:D-glycero-beta-D-manno-heptose-7-phosphate kinase [Bacteroidia bacterium]